MNTRLIHYFSVLLLLSIGGLTGWPLFAAEPSENRARVDRYGDPLPPMARLRIGTTRFRHGGEIVALAFAPDGRSIATLGRDNMLDVWDIASGNQQVSFHTPDGVAVAFGERGKALLWCNVRGGVYRFAADQKGENREGRRQRVHYFELVPSERIDVAVFAADGSRIVVGTSRNRILFWKRQVELSLRHGLQALALDRDGQRLAVNDKLKGISVDEVSGLRERGRVGNRTLGANAVRSLAFSPDGRLLAAGDFDNRIRLWDANAARELHLLEGHRRVPISGRNGVFCLVFSPDSTKLASGAADGTVRVWDVRSGEELACCGGHGGPVRALAFAPDGRMLASAGTDNALRLWDPATGREIGPVPDKGGAVLGMSLSHDEKTLALVQMPGQLRLWDVRATKELTNTPKLPAPVAAAVFAPKDPTLICASVEGGVHFWNYEKGQEERTKQNAQRPIRLLASASDGKTVAWCGYDHRIVLWDATIGKELQQFRPQGDKISELIFSPDGRTLLVAGSVGLNLFAIQDKSHKSDLLARGGSLFAGAVSPDGRMAATGGQSGAVRLWETASGKQRRTMFADTASVLAAAFSNDGSLLATGSSNGQLHLWDVVTGQRLLSFTGHRGAVVAVAFAERHATLISASIDGTALLWDLPALLKAGRESAIELSPRQVEALWSDLASDDARRAYEAGLTLARAPAQTVPFLRERVTPVTAEKMDQRIKELDSDEYTIRLRAATQLAEMGTFAAPALRKLLAERPSLEARQRSEQLLTLLDNPSAMTEHLRALRAVEVMERIGSESARQALQVLAKGADEAALTREAKTSLDRLNRKRLKATSPR